MRNTLEKIRALCNNPVEPKGVIEAISRLIDETIGPEKKDPHIIDLFKRRFALIQTGLCNTKECINIEQEIAEIECPFKVGDLIKGCSYGYDCPTPCPLDYKECDDESTCPKSTQFFTENIFLIGSIAFHEPRNEHRSDETHYVLFTHDLIKNKPSRVYKNLTDFNSYDCVPATKIGTMAPPIYYPNPKGGTRRRLLVAFPDIDSIDVVQKAREKEIKNPLPNWAK
jgi:hypothetical protein